MAELVDVTVTVENHKEDIIKALTEQAAAGLKAIGLTAESYAKQNITDQKAVDTGRLRNSITHAVEEGELAVYIGTNVEYAPYIELGTGIYAEQGGRQTPWSYQDDDGVWHTTRGQKPRPYLRPAAANHADEYKSLMEEALKNG